MGEFSEAVKQRYFKPKNAEIAEKMKRQRVKSAILSTCEKYLQSDGDVLTFEVLKGELPYVVEAITDDIIKSRYIISQVSESIFTAKMIEVDLDL